MGKSVFVKFVSEPRNDQLKAIIGIACAAQAIGDGHEVSVFFAGSTMVSDMLNKIFDNAVIYCSFASVKATLGHSEGDGALNIADDKIVWSGPPGVIKLATNSDVQLTY
jgi:hypothetical protein